MRLLKVYCVSVDALLPRLLDSCDTPRNRRNFTKQTPQARMLFSCQSTKNQLYTKTSLLVEVSLPGGLGITRPSIMTQLLILLGRLHQGRRDHTYCVFSEQ